MNIAVIGGGISGLTTATLLQLSGHGTIIYTQERPSEEVFRGTRPPAFASLHAAASILPHSVESERANHWTAISQHYFRALAYVGQCAVREQTHYEIFEQDEVPPPKYWRSLRNFEHLASDELERLGVPRRRHAEVTSGWRFDVMFCEAPAYIAYLYRLYRAAGGTVMPAPTVSRNACIVDYLQLKHKVYVNCTGQGASRFLSCQEASDVDDRPRMPDFEPLNDKHEQRFLRGHYLRVDIKEPCTDVCGKYFSYNYTPERKIYCTQSGSPADVYCYPRTDSWLLGGSRQVYKGPLDSTLVWNGEETTGAEETFLGADGEPVRIPAPIFTLNRDILNRMTDGRLDLDRLRRDRPKCFRAGIGLRFQRAGVDGSVRVACSRVFSGTEKFVIHNYGHGGSGFALSWGCALDVLKTVNRINDGEGGEQEESQIQVFSEGHAATELILRSVTGQLLAESHLT